MDEFSDQQFLRGRDDGMTVVSRWVQRNEAIAEFADDDRECGMRIGSVPFDLLARVALDKESGASSSASAHPAP